jgi:hypothetical protein
MDTEFLVDLRRNLQSLIDASGMTVEDYAKSKMVPKEVLEAMLACRQHDPGFATNLAVLSERLGFSVVQLLSPDLSNGSEKCQIAASFNSPRYSDSDHLLARQLGRLIEDFVECDEAGRFEVTALAQELAEERLRRTGTTPRATS